VCRNLRETIISICVHGFCLLRWGAGQTNCTSFWEANDLSTINPTGWCRQQLLLKSRYTCTRLHGVTFQKAAVFTVSVVKSSVSIVWQNCPPPSLCIHVNCYSFHQSSVVEVTLSEWYYSLICIVINDPATSKFINLLHLVCFLENCRKISYEFGKYDSHMYKMTNKMQLCRIIYYSLVTWLLYMFRAILLLIIRSIYSVITASGFIHVCQCWLQPTTHMNKTRSCNYSLDAPDDER
jgi:hypothetical protein